MLRNLHPVGFLRVLSTDFLVVAAGYESRGRRGRAQGSYALSPGGEAQNDCIVLGVRRKKGDSGQDSREDTNEEWDGQERGCSDKDTETHR